MDTVLVLCSTDAQGITYCAGPFFAWYPPMGIDRANMQICQQNGEVSLLWRSNYWQAVTCANFQLHDALAFHESVILKTMASEDKRVCRQRQ